MARSPSPTSARASRWSDPTRLDVAAFAKAQASLEGHTPLTQMPRLCESLVSRADGAPDADGAVHWHLQGLWKEATARPAEIRLRVRAQGRLWLTCQRCLHPVAQEVDWTSTFRFVEGEDDAARMDEEAGDEEDVLALPRSLKVSELIEDELILGLPIVPLHEACPKPLPVENAVESPNKKKASAHIDLEGAPPSAPEKPHPFAVLAQLKKNKG